MVHYYRGQHFLSRDIVVPRHCQGLNITATMGAAPLTSAANRVEEEQQWLRKATEISLQLLWCKVLCLIYGVNDLIVT